MKNELVVVTGSRGRIGRSLLPKLSKRYTVVGLDLPPRKDPPQLEGPLEEYQIGPAEFIETDFSCDDSVFYALERVKAHYGNRIASVIHLAAYYSFEKKHSPLYEKVTVEGTKRLLKALVEFDLDQFVFSSTLLVYKPCRLGCLIQEDSPVDPKWDYPLSKIQTEGVIQQLSTSRKNLNLRISGVYDDYCNSVPISHQIQRIYENKLESRLFSGNLEHGAPFLHMDDLVEAIVLSVEKRMSLPDRLTLLLGESKTLSYDRLQRLICRALSRSEFKTWTVPKWFAKLGAALQGMIPFCAKPFIKPWMIDFADDHYQIDIALARQMLGWLPKRDLEKTLPVMIKNLLNDPGKWYKINKINE